MEVSGFKLMMGVAVINVLSSIKKLDMICKLSRPSHDFNTLPEFILDEFCAILISPASSIAFWDFLILALTFSTHPTMTIINMDLCMNRSGCSLRIFNILFTKESVDESQGLFLAK